MRSFYTIAILCLLGACSPTQRFNKENNFFEFYRQLFDSVKNTVYPGKYTKDGDIMVLNFYNKKGEKVLGKKALINEEKKEIIFFDYSPAVNKKFVFK
jgi:hypothetical protein